MRSDAYNCIRPHMAHVQIYCEMVNSSHEQKFPPNLLINSPVIEWKKHM